MKILFIVMLLLMLCPCAAHAANPIIRESKPGKRVYSGDPAALVVDTEDDGANASRLARTFIPVEADIGVAYESVSLPGKTGIYKITVAGRVAEVEFSCE